MEIRPGIHPGRSNTNQLNDMRDPSEVHPMEWTKEEFIHSLRGWCQMTGALLPDHDIISESNQRLLWASLTAYQMVLARRLGFCTHEFAQSYVDTALAMMRNVDDPSNHPRPLVLMGPRKPEHEALLRAQMEEIGASGELADMISELVEAVSKGLEEDLPSPTDN